MARWELDDVSGVVVAVDVLRAFLAPEAPSYVITGRFPDHPDGGEDDLLTARRIERARLGQTLDAAATADAVARSPEAARTLAVGEGHVDPDDITYATALRPRVHRAQ